MRSPQDATRFTATTPYASSHPPSASTSTFAHNPPPQPSETPAQKVARLKALHSSRQPPISTFDRLVLTGRTWADRAHRVVALSLIGATAVCGIYATFALGDMMLYNRRKRAEFYAAQKALYARHVEEARTAVDEGSATEQQLGLVRHEEEVGAERRKKEGKGGAWRWLRGSLMGGLKAEETVETEREEGGVEPGTVLAAVQEHERQEKEDAGLLDHGERRKGGMLDRLGERGEASSAEKSGWVPGWARKG